MKKLLLTLLGVLTMLPASALDVEYTYEGQTLKSDVLEEGDKANMTKAGISLDEGLLIYGDYNIACDGEYQGVHYWGGVSPSVWPGIEMTTTIGSDGRTYKVAKIDDSSTGVIFNGRNGEYQTADLQYTPGFLMNHSGSTGIPVVFEPSPLPDFTYEYKGQIMQYRILDEDAKTCSVMGYEGNSKSFIIPEAVEYEDKEYRVTEFFSPAFVNMEILVLSRNIIPTFSNFGAKRISYIDEEHPADSYQISSDGKLVLGDNGKTLLYADLKGLTAFSIPDGVELIKSDAFALKPSYNDWTDCISLEELTVPASIREVEADAFYMIFPQRVNFIDWENWYYNVALGNRYSVPYSHSFIGAATDVPALIYAGGIQITTPPPLKEGMTEIKDYINWGLDGYKDEIELPSTLKRIGAYAFYNNKALYNVFLNDGLEEIGEYAFSGCELLENQKLPDSLKKIGEGAYSGCTSITEITLPETLTELGASVFSGCTSLEKAVIAVDIDTLTDNLFAGCKSLYKVYLPTNLKHIGRNSFSNCLALDEITLPSTLESIGDYAFSGGSLSKLIIPNSVKSIGIGSFSHQGIRDLSIGSGLEEIPEGAFEYNELVTINLSEGLKKIGSGAFSCASGPGHRIRSVILPSTLIEIGKRAFEYDSISELIIPDKLLSLPSGSCGIPALLTVGSGVKEIASDAFSFENLITFRLKATMPPTLSDAFPLSDDQNDRMTLVVNQGRKDRYTTNARWKQIANIVEEESTDVIVYLDGTYSLAEEIRMQSGLMPSRVSKLKVVGPLSEVDLRVMKENMVSLRSLDLREVSNITEIPTNQFGNSLLTEIIFPANLEKIGAGAFRECRLLNVSELPETLKYIGTGAFAECPGVTISRIPESVEIISSEAFKGCTGIREMTLENKRFVSEYEYGDVIFTNASERVFADCSLLERIDLSNTEVEVIGNGMFDGCHELDEIILPETVKGIKGSAFRGTAIRDLSFIPESMEELEGDNIFSNCGRLVSATLPKKMTKVEPNMFENCPRLLTVSIPAGVTSVGNNLVYGDKKLSNISCAAEVAPEAETGAFDNIRLRYVTLTIPTLSFRSYLNAPQWGKFETIMNRLPIPVSIDEGVDVSNVGEDDYQDMLREDRLEEAQEAAAQEPDEENSEQLRRRAARRAAARANTRSFASLFDGAQINCGSEGSGTRIFINPKEDVTVTSVKFNGKEMIDQLEDYSLLLPAGVAGNLEIRTNAPTSSIEAISSDIDFETAYDVYDLNGLLIGHDVDSLNAGIYIVRQKGAFKKISVRR